MKSLHFRWTVPFCGSPIERVEILAETPTMAVIKRPSEKEPESIPSNALCLNRREAVIEALHRCDNIAENLHSTLRTITRDEADLMKRRRGCEQELRGILEEKKLFLLELEEDS